MGKLRCIDPVTWLQLAWCPCKGGMIYRYWFSHQLPIQKMNNKYGVGRVHVACLGRAASDAPAKTSVVKSCGDK